MIIFIDTLYAAIAADTPLMPYYAVTCRFSPLSAATPDYMPYCYAITLLPCCYASIRHLPLTLSYIHYDGIAMLITPYACRHFHAIFISLLMLPSVITITAAFSMMADAMSRFHYTLILITTPDIFCHTADYFTSPIQPRRHDFAD